MSKIIEYLSTLPQGALLSEDAYYQGLTKALEEELAIDPSPAQREGHSALTDKVKQILAEYPGLSVGNVSAEEEFVPSYRKKGKGEAPVDLILEFLLDAHIASWKKRVNPKNSFNRPMADPSYREITKLGPAVVPMILKRLSQEPDLMDALYVLTNADPVPPEHYGILPLLINDWIKWGESIENNALHHIHGSKIRFKRNISHQKITYGKLEHVLLELDFKRLEPSPYRVYCNLFYDSMITLPNLTDEEIVDEVHFSGVLTNLVYKGVVKTETKFLERFAERVEKAMKLARKK